MLLILAFACSFYEKDPVDTAGDVGAATCDEKVYLPISLSELTNATVADAHTDTYGASPTPFQVVLGWPASDPSTSASFVWRTDNDTLASVVEWGEGTTLTERQEGYTFESGGRNSLIRVHEVKLCGRLKPNTQYSYRVGGDSSWSPTYSFTTPGAPGSFDTYTVAIAGDSRGSYETWGALVDAMETHAPDLYIFSGDMVELGTNQDEWDAWFAASGDVFARKPFLPAVGNHEFLAPNYFAQFSLPGAELYFSADYGDMHLVSLADMNVDQELVYGEINNWLDADLAAAVGRFSVVEHHFPAYSTCTTHGSNTLVRDAWVPTFEKHGVDLVVSGHNHIYERSVPIEADAEVARGDGTVYVVSGGAGAPLYEETENSWFGAVANPIEHYIIAEAAGDTVSFTAYDLAGNVIDTFEVPKE